MKQKLKSEVALIYLDLRRKINKELDNFLYKMEKSSNKFGCYFLYNENKEVVYVGLSVNLPRRSLESLSDRKNYIHYIAYLKTKTKSDMPIIESYFISKLKPTYNTTGKHEDKLTINLGINTPEKIFKIYN